MSTTHTTTEYEELTKELTETLSKIKAIEIYNSPELFEEYNIQLALRNLLITRLFFLTGKNVFGDN